MARPARIDYKTAMRSAIDSRSQPSGEGGVKAPGAAGSEQHRKGAGIGNEQNKLAPTEAGTGSRSGAKGGPSEHPQNLVAATAAGQGGGNGGPGEQPQNAEGSRAEERGESAGYESREDKTGANVVQGPRAVGRATEPIPHAGTGTQGRGGKGGGEHAGHPQNAAGPGSDGEGADGRGGAGGGAQKLGGHAQNRVLLVKSKHNADPGGEQPKKNLAGAIKRPGALTRAVGGKPSAKPGKVRELAAQGTPLQKKQAGFYLNVLAGH